MENQTVKKFTLWDSVVLLMLIIIIVPFMLGVAEGFFSQMYERLFANLLLVAIAIVGIVKYSKKLSKSIKSRKVKKE